MPKRLPKLEQGDVQRTLELERLLFPQSPRVMPSAPLGDQVLQSSFALGLDAEVRARSL